jgi:hypothetical protein
LGGIFVKFCAELQNDFPTFMINLILRFVDRSQFVQKIGLFIQCLVKLLSQRVIQYLIAYFNSLLIHFQFVEASSHVHEDGEFKIVLDLGNFIRILVFEVKPNETFEVGLEGFFRGVSFEEVIAFKTMGVDPFEFLLPGEGGDKLVDLLLVVELGCLKLELRDLPE